ncbi:hypothetical protein ACFQVD_39165 [Streptosporangium amethystogenes subsp. fukuiense]|uniref:Serine protease n=1 Tax=Streptosporangium amethystogenes subsp. fukuiense TaxID=698418 RepID=A0ABW2TDK8_9ACTN
MKRILLPAGGAILATGLLAAGLAGTATAAVPDWAYDTLAKDAPSAYAVAEFWTKVNGTTNNLAKATPYTWETKATPKLNAGGGYVADGKPGVVAPIGEEKKTAAKVKNVNLPKSIGKVFFVDADNNLKWCSATSIQGKYRNLVATAGHCVYDDGKDASVMDNWVFVPGYYQGKTPWGIYVGKTAYTHYDFANYEDYDKDFAFVTVYNGIQIGGGVKEVSYKEFQDYDGPKFEKAEEVKDFETYDKLTQKGYVGKVENVKASDEVGPDHKDATPVSIEVDKWTWEKVTGDVFAVKGNDVYKGNSKLGKHQWPAAGSKLASKVTDVTKSEYEAYKGLGYKATDGKGNYTITEYFVVKYTKNTESVKYVIFRHFISPIADVGRLGDNVGGQGFTWNQKPQQTVFVFGYPADAHPDGNKAYTGVTPKWTYGKTNAQKYVQAATKTEEHVGLKSSFTPGADGGPWLTKYSSAKRLGYVNGVTSLFGDQDANGRYDLITSPYFDGETAAIYTKAANVWSGSIVKK